MNYTIDDVVDAVRDALQGLPPNLDTTGFTTAITYPPLRTTLELAGIPLDPFIRPTMGVSAYVAADIYEDFINHYILMQDTPDLSSRDYLIRNLDMTKQDGKWVFPKREIAMYYLVRLVWLIGRVSGKEMRISDHELTIDGFPNVGFLNGEIKSHWFSARTPKTDFNIANLLYASSGTPRLRLRGDNLIRAYHNAGSLEMDERAAVRTALQILAAGYRHKVNFAAELNPPKRNPVGKSYRLNLRQVASDIRGFPGNPAPMIVRRLVKTEIIDASTLFAALSGLSTYATWAESYPIDHTLIKAWSRELRILGG